MQYKCLFRVFPSNKIICQNFTHCKNNYTRNHNINGMTLCLKSSPKNLTIIKLAKNEINIPTKIEIKIVFRAANDVNLFFPY